jgi:glutamate--cysteine ligase
MRGSDSGPWRRLPALPAFWVGLLYDDDCLEAAWDLVKDWSAAERQTLRDDVPRQGFKAAIRGRSMLELAKECLTLAHAGLKRRDRRDAEGRDETRYLAALGDIVTRGVTPAEDMLEKFRTAWGGSVAPAYEEYAY